MKIVHLRNYCINCHSLIIHCYKHNFSTGKSRYFSSTTQHFNVVSPIFSRSNVFDKNINIQSKFLNQNKVYNHKKVINPNNGERYYSQNFSISWKPKYIQTLKTEIEEKKKLEHLVENEKDTTPVKILLTERELKTMILAFGNNVEIKRLAEKNKIDRATLVKCLGSLRKLLLESKLLPTDLYITLEKIRTKNLEASEFFPYIHRHAIKICPHLEHYQELKELCNLEKPQFRYNEARSKKRRIIYHSGPTNSGKTYNALQSFLSASSGIYCSPLRLLAMEMYRKSNEAGVPCDLITGEERRYGLREFGEEKTETSMTKIFNFFKQPSDDEASYISSHQACTAEMIQLDKEFDVAIIDEIQTIRNKERGWAWTRALLGLNCKELHVCGEGSAIEVVRHLAEKCGDEFQVENYERLTPLEVENKPFQGLEDLQPGDCIVCFSRHDIMNLSRQIQSLGHEVAIIYGNLPPSTKLEMAKKFNDPDNPCKILVATDAIGMGLNLSIRRIIFYNIKTSTVIDGTKKTEEVDISSILQIAGRAGRFGTRWEKGFVTAWNQEDLNNLKEIMRSKPTTITKVGLQPELEIYELLSYYLPTYSFQQLLTLSDQICQIDDSLYFLSKSSSLKSVSEKLQHIPLDIKQRYTLSYSPISINQLFENQMFIKFSRHIAEKQRVTVEWLTSEIKWPVDFPKTNSQLHQLESVYNVLELYCWLSYNYPSLFDDVEQVREMKAEIESIIIESVTNYPTLQIPNDEKKVEGNSTTTLTAPEINDVNEVVNCNHINDSDQPISEKLLESGLITKNMLKKMRREWFYAQENKSLDEKEVTDISSNDYSMISNSYNDVNNKELPSNDDDSKNLIMPYNEIHRDHLYDDDRPNFEGPEFFFNLCESCNIEPKISYSTKHEQGAELYECKIEVAKYSSTRLALNKEESLELAINDILSELEVSSNYISNNDSSEETENVSSMSITPIKSKEIDIFSNKNNFESSQSESNSDFQKVYDTYFSLKPSIVVEGMAATVRINNLCQKAKINPPVYTLIEKYTNRLDGYRVKGSILNYEAEGEGRNIRAAREDAASQLLQTIIMESTDLNDYGTEEGKNGSDNLEEMNRIRNSLIILSGSSAFNNPIQSIFILCAKSKVKAPSFSFAVKDDDSEEYFSCNLLVAGIEAEGCGRSKKDAKSNAAQSFIDKIEQLGIEKRYSYG